MQDQLQERQVSVAERKRRHSHRAPVAAAVIILCLAFGAQPASASGDLDCTDFGTRESAQQQLDAQPFDRHGLDSDVDGEACERLPSASKRGALASIAVGLVGAFLWQRFEVDGGRWSGEDYLAVLLGGAMFACVGCVGVWIAIQLHLPRSVPTAAFALIGAALTSVTAAAWASYHGAFRRTLASPINGSN